MFAKSGATCLRRSCLEQVMSSVPWKPIGGYIRKTQDKRSDLVEGWIWPIGRDNASLRRPILVVAGRGVKDQPRIQVCREEESVERI